MSVKGRLKDMSLADIIHIFHEERKSVTIHLSSEMGYGRIYMRDGNVIHASYRKSNGLDAVYHLLAWQDGEFEVEAGAPTQVQTIDMPVQALLLEGLRRLDEQRSQAGESKLYNNDMESLRLLNKLLELGILEKIKEGLNDG